MLKLYLNTDEYTLEDMLLNASEHTNLNFICNDEIEDLDEDKADMARNYGYDVHNGFDLFRFMKERVYEVLRNTPNTTLCIDNLSNWMIGIDRDATTIEGMYTEPQLDELDEFLTALTRVSFKHDISILCNEYMLQYMVDNLTLEQYILID